MAWHMHVHAYTQNCERIHTYTNTHTRACTHTSKDSLLQEQQQQLEQEQAACEQFRGSLTGRVGAAIAKVVWGCCCN